MSQGGSPSILGPVVGAALIGALAGALLPVVLVLASGPRHDDPRWKRDRARANQEVVANAAGKDSFGAAALRGLVGALVAGGAAAAYLLNSSSPQRSDS